MYADLGHFGERPIQIDWFSVVGPSLLLMVLAFRTSTNLAAAYGIAVSTTMVITTILAYFVSRDLFGWSRLTAGAVTAAFFVVDVAFFSANMFKVRDGGWFPLLVAAIVFTVTTTWRRGRQILNQRIREGSLTPERFLESVRSHRPVRVPGSAVFLSHLTGQIPDSLLHSLRHYKVLHEQVLILTVVTDEVSRVEEPERLRVESLGEGLFHVLRALAERGGGRTTG